LRIDEPVAWITEVDHNGSGFVKNGIDAGEIGNIFNPPHLDLLGNAKIANADQGRKIVLPVNV
jgi:hypothetical protein